jgi:hypothetical protein
MVCQRLDGRLLRAGSAPKVSNLYARYAAVSFRSSKRRSPPAAVVQDEARRPQHDGCSYGLIGRELGLSKNTVAEIVKGNRSAAGRA